MNRSNEVIAFVVSSDLYDIREDGTIYSRISRQGHITDQWRRVDRLDKRTGRYKLKACDHPTEAARVIYWKFKGPIPAGMHVDHINEIRTDNRPENLQLLTPGENSAKSHRKSPQRLAKTARDHRFNARFSEDDVRAMRQKRSAGRSLGSLAREYGVGKSHMSEICNYKIWKSVSDTAQ